MATALQHCVARVVPQGCLYYQPTCAAFAHEGVHEHFHFRAGIARQCAAQNLR